MAEVNSPPANCVLTIGNFDGVHVGHQEIFRRVREHSARIQGVPVAFTFRPHPYFVLRPSNAPQLINTYEEKIELMGRHGIEAVVEESFSREFSNTSPEQFVDRLVKQLGVKVLYLGYDFAFGKGRAGSVETLKALAEARGVELFVVPEQKVEGHTVSSSYVRGLLDEGNLELVNRCLARPFFLRGLVWRGEGRGRTIGVPTANIQTEARKYPKVGVYATRTLWRDRHYDSISNIGYNPTFKGEGDDLPLKVETHLFDFSEDMYGDEIRVDFHSFLRPERKFAGVSELLEQIKQDSLDAKKFLAGV